MAAPKTFSTSKIIFFLVFICAALFSLIFVFHLRQEQPSSMISSDAGTIFTVPQEVKHFSLVSADNQKFTQKNLLGHWTLMFFGFTHCAEICPTTLATLKEVQATLAQQIPNLQVVFVSLDPERDAPDTIQTYVSRFNPAFIGITGKAEELHKLQSQFHIFSSEKPAQAGHNYQIQHTSSIMLINPQAKWTGLYRYGLPAKELASSLKNSIKAIG